MPSWESKNVMCSCKKARDFSRELRNERSSWFALLMTQLGRLDWTDKPGREWTKTFIKKWDADPQCKVQRQLRFGRILEEVPVVVEIKDTIVEQLTVAQREVTKECTNIVRMFVVRGPYGVTEMHFQTNRCTTTLEATGRGKKVTGEYNRDDVEEYQGVPLRTWQDLRVLMFSPEFLTKPFDKALVVPPRI